MRRSERQMSGVRTSWQRYTRGCHPCTLICCNFLEATDGSPKAHLDIQAWSLAPINLFTSVSPIISQWISIQQITPVKYTPGMYPTIVWSFWAGLQLEFSTFAFLNRVSNGSTDSGCKDLDSQLDIPGKGEPQLRNWEDQIELCPFLWGIFLIGSWYKRAKPSVTLGWWVWAL